MRFMSPETDPQQVAAKVPPFAAFARVSPDFGLAALVGMLALGVYVRTLCPTIYLDDCGEIATAVATGGVMHPPGYPLYSLLGLLVSHVITAGEPAWRIGLISAVCGAGAVSAVYLLCRRVGLPALWAGLGALAFATSYTLWQQSTKVETYALNALLVSVLLNLAVRYVRLPTDKNFLSLAFFGGIALTNHLSIIWLIPALLWMTLATMATHRELVASAPRLLLQGVGLCLLPLILYGYEAIAAIRNRGGQVWGDPSTPYRLYLQITGALYHGYLGSLSPRALVHLDLVFLPWWLWQNAGLLLPMSLLGAAVLIWGNHPKAQQVPLRTIGIGLCIGVVSYLIGNSIYGILNIFEYYTPVVLLLCVLGPVGARVCVHFLKQVLATSNHSASLGLARAITIALVVVCPTVNAIRNWSQCDRSGAVYSRDLALNTLASLPQHAVVVSDGDNRTFPLWYAQDILGARPDVTIVARGLLFNWQSRTQEQEFEWGLLKLAHHDPQIDPSAVLRWHDAGRAKGAQSDPLVFVLQRAISSGRPLFFTTLDKSEYDQKPGQPPVLRLASPKMVLIYQGLGFMAFPANRAPTLAQTAQEDLRVERLIHIQYVPESDVAYEPDGTFINKVYASALANEGLVLQRLGRFDLSFPRLQTALALDPQNSGIEDSYALSCMQTGRQALAVALWTDAVSRAPANTGYRHNLQIALSQTAVNGRS